MKIEKWKLQKSKNILTTKWITIDAETLDTPNGTIDTFYVIREPRYLFPPNPFILSSWSVVIPITPQNEIILVEQYRRGSDTISLELPAGDIDNNETPEQAALRELQEETGYEAMKKPIPLGYLFTEPSRNTNRGYGFVVFVNETPTGKQKLDEHENIRVKKLSIKEVQKAIQEGRINHSCHVAFLFRAFVQLGLLKWTE
jgi:ADP-ribose pyrophosphatase